MQRNWLAIAGVLTMSLVSLADADDKYLKAFPAAEDGKSRFVILLPHKERGVDNNFKVELFVGKEMMTDGVNTYRLGGKIEAKPLKGWGFTYYEVEKIGPAISTRKEVPPGTPTVKKFVAMPSTTIPYNSRVPVVIYVPKGASVEYRLWRADEENANAKEG